MDDEPAQAVWHADRDQDGTTGEFDELVLTCPDAPDVMDGLALPERTSSHMSDCDDDNPAIVWWAKEITNDRVDNDCDGLVDERPGVNDPDNDRDGYPESNDCDDDHPLVYPGAIENPWLTCDIVDQDCDGDPNTRNGSTAGVTQFEDCLV
jgi:hypothetical protein